MRSPLIASFALFSACGPQLPSPEPVVELSATPECWMAPPVTTGVGIASVGPSALLDELRLGHGLDALERMLAPHLRDPTRARWSAGESGQGFEIRTWGQVGADGELTVGLEVYDLLQSAVRPIERWAATVRRRGTGWSFELAGRPGVVNPRYVRWGRLRKGCDGELSFRASGDAVSCWRADGTPSSPEPCRALEARLLEAL